MKAIFIAGALLLLGGIAYGYCMTDYKCLNDCLKMRYGYSFCTDVCSYCR